MEILVSTSLLRTTFFFLTSKSLKEFFTNLVSTSSSPAQSVIIFHSQSLTKITHHFAL